MSEERAVNLKKVQTVHVVGAQETNYPWGFENKIIPALQSLGFSVLTTDYRKQRERLSECLTQPADLFLVCKGELIPPDMICNLRGVTALWYAELLGTEEECDEISARKRQELVFNVGAFDQVFSHDHSNLGICRKLGARRVSWLSTAVVDPSVNRRLHLRQTHDIVFAGSMTPYRERIIGELRRQGITVEAVNLWNPCELNELYNRSKIILNIHSSALPNTESRIAEVLGSGGFMISEKLSCPDLLRDGSDYIAWTSGEVKDLAELIRYYLAREGERRRIAACGYGYVRRHHTVERRIAELMEKVDLTLAEQIWPSHSFGVLHDRDGRRTLRLDAFYAAVRGLPTSTVAGSSVRGETERSIHPLESSQNSPMNILLVAHAFVPESRNGTEIHTYETAHELIRRGHVVCVLYPCYRTDQEEGIITEDTYDGIPLARISVTPGQLQLMSNPEVAEAVAKYAQSLGVDVVHFQHLIGVTAASVETVSARGIPTVVTLRDGWLLCEQIHLLRAGVEYCNEGPESVAKCTDCYFARNPSLSREEDDERIREFLTNRRKAASKVFCTVDQVIVPSRFLQSVFLQDGLFHPYMTVIPHGVRQIRLHPWRAPDGFVRFAYLGSIYQTKGLDIALRAFSQLPPDAARLNIYGHIVDPQYFEDWMRPVRNNARIEYMGPYEADDLGRILAETDVVVVPSRIESYSHVVRESLSARVPVIGSDVGGISEVVTDGINGLLFAAGDPQSLARAMKVFTDDPTRVTVYQKRIEPVTTMKENVDELERVYRSVVARKQERRHAFTETPAVSSSNETTFGLSRRYDPNRPCPVCAESAALALTKRGHPYYQCGSCRAVFTAQIDASIVRTENQDAPGRHNPSKDETRLLRMIGATVRKITRVLDYGCGNGEYGRYLKDRIECVGIDRHTALQLKDIDDATMDGINAVEVIEHIFEPVEVLTQFYRILKPLGVVYLESSFVRGQDLASWEYLDPSIGHCLVHSERSLALMAMRLGFELQKFNDNVFFLKKPVDDDGTVRPRPRKMEGMERE